MKLMTYNLLNGAKETLPQILEIIGSESPDFLTINEANTFTANNNKILKEVAAIGNFPCFELAPSGEYDYHVAIFSKYPWFKVEKIRPMRNAGIIASFKSNLGLLSIAGAHLTPISEDLRLPEIDLIADLQKDYDLKIIMGDMNSLSRHDDYDPEIINDFNRMQLRKFTTDGKLRFDAIDKILSNGYLDISFELAKNHDRTAPTSINEYSAHSNMRLDYIFISKSLAPYIKNYSVIKNDVTETASDHYPVVCALERINLG